MKKYELTEETVTLPDGTILCRIKSLTAFENPTGGSVLVGDLDGFAESEANLSYDYTAWIADNAQVYGNAMMYGDAEVYNYAQVYCDAKVYGHAKVLDNAEVYGSANVWGKAKAYGTAEVWCNAVV